MANVVFNVAKGRAVELYNRVQTQDPSTSRLVLVLLAASGLESDLTLLRKATLAAVVSGTTNEITNTGYARLTLAHGSLTAISPDNTNDWNLIDLPDQTFPTVSAGDSIAKLVICYDAVTGSGTDADVVPLTLHDFVPLTALDGSDVTVGITNFFKAQ